MLSVIMLRDAFYYRNAENHYAECHHISVAMLSVVAPIITRGVAQW
jgi:hypothetical protein